MPLQTATQDLMFLGIRARVLVDAEASEGHFGLLDMIEAPPGDMPPLHVHHAQDEGFYVVSGEVTFYLPDEEIALRPGDFFLAPKGIPHTFRVGAEPARFLVTSSPAGFEQFVCDVAALDVPDPARLAAIAARYDIEILGPPGMLP